MRNTRKILVALLVLMTILVSLAAVTISASAASTAGSTLYLKPNSNWVKDNARFAAYFMDSTKGTTKWISMTDNDGDGYYEVTIPSGSWKYVIFCRMNPGSSTNDWNNKWNQTGDLTIPTDSKNCFTVPSGSWDGATTSWSAYTPACTNHVYDKYGKCTNDGCTAGHTYTVAGDNATLLGTSWDVTNTANDMLYDPETKVYTKVYNDVAAGTYLIKCAQDHAWSISYGGSAADGNYQFTVDKDGSIVTITLTGTVIDVEVVTPHVHSWSDATCTEPQKCECGETQGEALGHTAGAAATCTAAQTCTVCNAELAAALGHKDEDSNYICDTCKEKLCTEHSEEVIPGKAATCTETGLTEGKKCSICGEILVAQEEISVIAHSYEAVLTEPTCVAKGYTTYTCSCGDSYTADEVEPTGKHTYVDGKCSVCNSIVAYCVNSNEWTKINAHAWITDGAGTSWPGVAMSKTEDTVNGFEIYVIEFATAYENIIFNNGSSQTQNLTLQAGKYYDLSSGAWYDSLDAVPAPDPLKTDDTVAGSFNGWNTGSHAFRLEEEGGTVSYISLELEANTTYEFKILKNGVWHGCSATITESVENYKFYSTTDANCKLTTTVAGTYVFALSGTQLSITYPHVHSWSDATCTEPQKCECGETQGEALGHTAGAAATCTAAQTCTVCNAELAAALGHKDEDSNYICDTCKENLCTEHSEEVIPGKAATCTETGLTEGKKCSICGEILVAQEEIPMIDHSYEAVVTEPTCVAKGYTTYTCSCGDSYTADEVEPTGKHAYVDGACSVCGDIDLNNTVTVYFQNNWLWSDVCVYYWYGEDATPNASWPGAKAEKVGNDGTYDIYSVKVPVKVSGIIFSGIKDDGSNSRDQSPNITSGWTDCLCYHMTWEEGNAVGSFKYHSPEADDGDCTTAVSCSVCGEVTTEAKASHTWENCECASCDAVLTKAELTDSFDFTTAEGLAAALASGKIGHTGTFRNNGDSHQFAADSSIQLIVPAYTTVTITGHSVGYGVFDVYVDGVKQDMAGNLKFFVIEDTKVVIVPNAEATYSKAYLKGISFEEYVDRTIYEDTTINFGSEGNYKDSIVDFSGIQIGDNGGNNSQVKNGSFDLLLKAGAVVKIHGYPGYTSYQLNGGDEITAEFHTYIALEDTTLKVTPVNGNNYFYSIEIVYHEGVALVAAKDATCTEVGNADYYICTCHADPLTDKGEIAALGHTEATDAAVAPTCTASGLTEGKHCSVCNEVLVAQETVAALGHSYGAVVTAPTCTAGGYTTYTCSVCGNSYVADEVEAKGHTEVTDAAVAPTCTASGLTEGKHCSVCNEVLVAQTTVAALGHTEVTDAAVAPTCTASGLTEGKHCSVCNEVLVAQETVAALGHTEETVAGKAATCTETGLTDGKKCSVCGTVILAQSEIPALGHTDENKDYTCDVCGADLCTDHTVVTIPGKAATCTETGLTEGKKCSTCGDVLEAQTVINALGHSYSAVVTAPTCTEAGYTTYTCSACSDSYVADEVAALGHSYDEGVVTTDPTCTAEGVKTFTCSCGHSYTESVSVLAHDYSAAVTDPTCTAGGYTTYTCSVCGHSYVADELDALGHSYSAVVTAPTCTAGGYTTYTCSACNDSYVADELDALGHDIIVDAAVAPTCTESGLTEGSHCSRCDHKVEREVVPAKGHSDEDNNYVCDVCNADLCTEHTEEILPGKAATCTEAGLTEGKKCSACGEILVAQTVIDALGHDLHKLEEIAPTCTTDGVEAGEECSRCDHKVGLGVIDSLGHDFSEGQCTRCGEKDPDYVAPHVHVFVEGKCECGETDPEYVAPEQPDDNTPEEPQPEPELNFFQKIVKAIADFFKAIGNWFKNLFAKK